jgi:class 3 adenylate cyclase
MSHTLGSRLRLHGLLLILLLLVLPSLEGLAQEAPKTGPRAGRLDLSALPRGGTASLDGEWEFYWGILADPTALAAGQGPEPELVPFPGEWKDYGKGYPPTGFGTYRLRLSGLDTARDWGFRMASVLSAARVFVNGREVMAFGKPGTSAAAEEAGWRSHLALIRPAQNGVADIVVQLSNYADRSGGLRTSMTIGDFAAVQRDKDRTRLFELFSVGALLIMGLYYLFLFGFRPTERPPLYFGLLCLSLALRIICYDEYFILDLVPRLSWLWLFRLGYLCFTFPVLFTAAFISTLFPARAWKPARWIALAACLGYSLVIVLGGSFQTSVILPFFQVFTGLLGLYLVLVLVLAIAAHETGSLIFLGGFLLLFGAAIHDMLVSGGAIRGSFWAQYGLLVFVFSMALVMTRKLAGSFARAESLSAELARTNKPMKRFVPEEFMAFLGKSSVEQVRLGDHSQQDMAVMFADIRSFTALSERLPPEGTFRFINQYLARMGPTIRGNGGFVDKYMGDGIMALFPGSPEDAARCAIDMHMRLDEYNLQRQSAGEAPIRIGIGIHWGGIMLGTIGENERMDGTVLSDAVNVASRLEGVAKDFGVGVVASEAILAGLSDRGEYRTRYLGKVGVKGKRDLVPVFELYDGDPEELRARKDLIKAPFQKALVAFYAQDYASASVFLKQVQALMPEDEACQHYTRIIRRLRLS